LTFHTRLGQDFSDFSLFPLGLPSAPLTGLQTSLKIKDAPPALHILGCVSAISAMQPANDAPQRLAATNQN
jgi:hypothetical protein